MRKLIIYYSHTGSIDSLVDRVKNYSEVDTLKLELELPYSTETEAFVKRVREELKNNLLPSYKAVSINFNKYSKVLFMVPNWGNTVPPVVKTFFRDYSLEGHIIYPVISHGGNGEAGILNQIKELTKSSSIAKELVIFTNQITDEELKEYLIDFNL